jgi:hypothetical protein
MKQAEIQVGSVYLTRICGSLAPVVVVEKIEPSRYDRPGTHTRYRIRREDSSSILAKSRTAAALRLKPAPIPARVDMNPEGTARLDASLARLGV